MPVAGKDLCEALSIDRKQLKAWIDAGLPWTGTKYRRKFEADQVIEWLRANNLIIEDVPLPAAAPARAVATIGEVASELGVTYTTVKTWLHEGMPGTPGGRGARDGWFPIEEIRRWVAERKNTIDAPDDAKHQSQARLLAAKAEMAELDLAVKQGKLVNAEQVARRRARSAALVKSMLGQYRGAAMSILPQSANAQQRQNVRDMFDGITRQICLVMRDDCLRQADETEGAVSDEDSAEQEVADDDAAS